MWITNKEDLIVLLQNQKPKNKNNNAKTKKNKSGHVHKKGKNQAWGTFQHLMC